MVAFERYTTYKPMTSEKLTRELRIEHGKLQRVLEYLYMHTAEIAALDMMGKHTGKWDPLKEEIPGKEEAKRGERAGDIKQQ